MSGCNRFSLISVNTLLVNVPQIKFIAPTVQKLYSP